MSGRSPLRETGAMCLTFLAIALTASCSNSGTHTQSFSPSSSGWSMVATMRAGGMVPRPDGA